MRQLVIGKDEAKMVDNKGNVYEAIKVKNGWLFQGSVYASPFEAFKEVVE